MSPLYFKTATGGNLMHHNSRNVYSIENGRKEKDKTKDLMGLGRKYNIHEIISLKPSEICVAEWVRLKCRYGCNKYGTSWCCPPETPAPEKTRAFLNEYQEALLLCGSIENDNFYRNNQQKRRVQMTTWKGTVGLERHLFLSGYYKAFALVSECCALCKSCAYPDACRFPNEKRPSVESCAIDAFQTLKNVGRAYDLAHDLKEEYNYYSIILLE